ncbi:MAG: hypothetical protein WAO55_10515 [Candidatus Manganitrophaceae bacterium]
MNDAGKEMMLNAAVGIGKLYAFLAQALRMVLDPQVAAQLPEDLIDKQIDQIRADLAPLLEKNHVVKENLEKVCREVMRIRQSAQNESTRRSAAREAESYLIMVAERARTVSDLVALFRRL